MTAPAAGKTGGENILALCGGVGGAKLVAGLTRVFKPEELTIVVNTADDFVHWGLNISPDLDSVMYKIAGANDTERGWGRKDESWAVLESIKELGGESWFQLGDKDLGIHLMRTMALNAGSTLSDATRQLASAFRIHHKLIPMSDDRVGTFVTTDEGEISFQEYFVGKQCAPEVKHIRFDNVENASPSPGFMEVLTDVDLTAVIVCPSNPFVSIDPVLALPGVRAQLRVLSETIPVIAVSPIIQGQAVKGPAAKMFESLGLECSAMAVAGYYKDFINGMVIDIQDESLLREVGDLVPVKAMQTIMRSDRDEEALAESLCEFAKELRITIMS